MEEIMHDLCTRKGETCGVKKKRKSHYCLWIDDTSMKQYKTIFLTLKGN